jgi:hypothetical protein
MVSLSEKTGVAVKQGYTINAKASFSVTNGLTGETTDYVYDDTSDETKENTTAIVNKGDTVELKVEVKNNAKTYLDHCTLFIPLMNEGADYGTGFMPEGANGFSMTLQDVTVPDSFEIKYIKFKSDAQYSVNEAPQPSDYDVVTDLSEADMVMLVSTSAIADGYGGTVTLTFSADDDLTEDDAGKRIVITPILDYDINGNTSTQTKEAAAVTYGGGDDTDEPDDNGPSDTTDDGTDDDQVQNDNSVNTGDDSSQTAYLLLLLVAGCGIAAAVRIKQGFAVKKER